MGTRLPLAGSSDVVLVWDFSCWMHRFWATVGPWAAHNFSTSVGKLLDQQRPAYAAVCCDLPFPTFRHALAPRRAPEPGAVAPVGYKAQRVGPDPGLLERMRWAREMLEDAHGIPIYAAKGYEADDCLAALVKQSRERGLRVIMMAMDKDMLQLVDGETCVMWDGRFKVWGPEEVLAKYGVRADQFRDYLSIVGDGVDNVPGVKGLGPHAAKAILGEFDTLETALEAAHSSPKNRIWAQSPSWRTKLVEQHDAALLSQKLVTLAHDAPVNFDFDAMKREDL